jgi:hypothetical protein
VGQNHFCARETIVVESPVAHRRPPRRQLLFDNQLNMLDQFLVNKNMATSDAAIKANPGTAQNPQTAGHGQSRYLPEAIRFGRMGKPVNQNGFSDHYPITMTVTDVD